MPFDSQKQRRYFWWLKDHPKEAKRRGIEQKDVEKMTEHDTGGKLRRSAHTKKTMKG